MPLGGGIAGQLADEGGHTGNPELDVHSVGQDIDALDEQLDDPRFGKTGTGAGQTRLQPKIVCTSKGRRAMRI